MWVLDKLETPQAGYVLGFTQTAATNNAYALSDTTPYLTSEYEGKTDASGRSEGKTVSKSGTSSYSESGSNSNSHSYSESDRATGGSGTDSFENTHTESDSGSNSNSYSKSGSFDGTNRTVYEIAADTHTTTSTSYIEFGEASSESAHTSRTIIYKTTSYGTGESIHPTTTTTATRSSTTPTFTTTDSNGSSELTTTSTSTTTSYVTSTVDTSKYVARTYQTTATTSESLKVAKAGTIVFEPNEVVWNLRRNESFEGLKEISEIGTRINDTQFVLPNTTSKTVGVSVTPTSSFVGKTQELETQISTLTETYYVYVYTNSYTTEYLEQPPLVLPNRYSNLVYHKWLTTSESYEVTITLNNITSITSSVYGSSGSSYATLEYNTTISVYDFLYDDQLRITGTTTASLSVVSTTEVSQVFAVTTGGVASLTNGYTSVQYGGGGTTESGSTTYHDETTTTGVTGYSASLIRASATILEATFDPAVRYSTSGKSLSVTGPAGSVFYPYWSQVWNGLWVPMTYANAKSTTYQNSQQSTSTGIEGESSTTSTTFYTTTGPTISATYSWDKGSVYMTTVTGSGTHTKSSSTVFGIAGSMEKSDSYYVSREPLVVAYDLSVQGAALVYKRENFVIGGSQWNDTPAQLWLGSGVWEVTRYQDGSSTSEKITVTERVQTSEVPLDMLVAARPVPMWRCCTAKADDFCLFAFTNPD